MINHNEMLWYLSELSIRFVSGISSMRIALECAVLDDFVNVDGAFDIEGGLAFTELL